MAIKVRRIYGDKTGHDGIRILVDRIWPRGVSKDEAQLDHWIKDVAPSSALRKWFGHDPDKWDEFKRRYFKELDAAPDAVAELRDAIGKRSATLLFAAKDEAHNNAVALKAYLEKD
ncbi:MAG TPA: DUF488 domain-containing protein [Gammaproteobacteria bacterium]|nr:DUF488 domain-containing protein [Gammaproteobacteria bacterium]